MRELKSCVSFLQSDALPDISNFELFLAVKTMKTKKVKSATPIGILY